MQRASVDLARLEEQRQSHRGLLAQYEAQARELQELRTRLASGQQELEVLHAQHAELVADREVCGQKLAEAEGLAAELEELERRSAAASAERLRQQGAVQELATQAEEARGKREEAARRWRRVLAVKNARQAQHELQELALALERLRETETQAVEVERQLQRPWPGDTDIRKGRELQEQNTGLQAQLQIAGLAMTMTFERQQRVEATGGAEAIAVEAEPGTPVTYQAGASLEVYFPGTARMRVTSGAREAAEIAAELQATQQQLAELLGGFQVTEVHALAELQAVHQDLERQRKELAEEIKRLAGAHRNRAGLVKQQALVEHNLHSLLAELALTAEQLAGEQVGDESALQSAEEQARIAQDDAERRLKALEDSMRLQQEAEQARAQERTSKHVGAQVARTQAAALLQRHKVTGIEALADLERSALESLQAREDALAELRTTVPPADPEALAAAQSQALEEVEREKARVDEARVRAELLVEQAQSIGRYEDLVLLEEQRQAASTQLERARLEAHAVSLLRQVLNERRQETVSPQLPHLEEAIQRMMEAVTTRSRPIKMGDQYSVEGMLDARGQDDVHGSEALSAGTREQLDLVTRIALGEAYAREYGRTMMVLDDALLYTDPDRHDRVKYILQRAAGLLQVFIFTSHPDRYRGIVEEGNRFDLADLVAKRQA